MDCGQAPTKVRRPGIASIAAVVLAAIVLTPLDPVIRALVQGLPAELSGYAGNLFRPLALLPGVVAAGALLFGLAMLALGRVRARQSIGPAVGAAFLLASIVGAAVVTVPLKHAIGRARPQPAHPDAFDFEPFAFQDSFASFPSTQAAMAGAMAIGIALLLPRIRTVLMVLGVLICLSRLIADAHWASDVAMGWAIGVGVASWLADAFARRGWLFVKQGGHGRATPVIPRQGGETTG